MTHEPLKLIECPRDAWQGLPRIIATELKVQYLRALIDAGFRHIDAVSFVSPQAVPQMADSEDVLAQLAPPPEVEIIGIVVNEKGADRAIATGSVTTLGFPCSISPTFLRRNQNQSPEENWATLRQIKQRADEAELRMVAYVSMAFGNPYGDSWNADKVVEAAKQIGGLGIKEISLADTIGIADSNLTLALLRLFLRECNGCEIGIHMHSTRAEAAAKILAAYDAGCRRFDSAMGGLGGCSFAQDKLVGNIPTEEVFRALEQRGVELASKLEAVLALNSAIREQFSVG